MLYFSSAKGKPKSTEYYRSVEKIYNTMCLSLFKLNHFFFVLLEHEMCHAPVYKPLKQCKAKVEYIICFKKDVYDNPRRVPAAVPTIY